MMTFFLNIITLLSNNYRINYTYYVPLNYPSDVYSHLARGYDNEGTFGYNKDITDYSLSFAASAGAMISSPNDVVKFLLQLFSAKIFSKKLLDRMKILVLPNGKKILNIKKLSTEINSSKKSWTQLGQGIGFGLVYFKTIGFVWMHAGGVNGYQSLYGYSPCNGVIVALAYSKQPKDKYVFLKIYEEVMQKVNSLKYSKNLINNYKVKLSHPNYCKY